LLLVVNAILQDALAARQKGNTMTDFDQTRRNFLMTSAATGGVVAAGSLLSAAEAQAAVPEPEETPTEPVTMNIHLRVNGNDHQLMVDPRATLLDTLRERLHLTGSKKGCDQGQCGACTVISDGRRITSCLTLAVMQQGHDITTIEGLGTPGNLHPCRPPSLSTMAINAASARLDKYAQPWPCSMR
jgi:xanthine dehydrogenase YagT iron-sulfur-binding subunit